MRVRSLCLLTWAAMVLAGTGCGPGESSVSGVVNMDGQPLDHATVMFHPTTGKGKTASGLSDSNGSFKLSEMLPAGEYAVTVSKTEGPMSGGDKPLVPGTPEYNKAMQDMSKKKGAKAGVKSLVPSQYTDAGKTPFKFRIPQSDPITLELKSK